MKLAAVVSCEALVAVATTAHAIDWDAEKEPEGVLRYLFGNAMFFQTIEWRH